MQQFSIQTGSDISKYQVTIQFSMDDQFMTLVPAHRTYINYLINKGIIDAYTVSLESRRSWIIINASSKKEVEDFLSRSPLFKYWTFEIDELYVFDGQSYRLPAIQMN
jgi:muconolactone delta-isomerase